MSKKNKRYDAKIFTDGACRRNPDGPGGWAALIQHGNNQAIYAGAEESTTNNRMEMTAALMGLRQMPTGAEVLVVTDSKYLRNGISQWIHNWKRRCWKTRDNKPVKNQDLWMSIDAECQRMDVDWKWVKGHSGHIENEICDAAATKAIDDMLAGIIKAETVCTKSADEVIYEHFLAKFTELREAYRTMPESAKKYVPDEVLKFMDDRASVLMLAELIQE